MYYRNAHCAVVVYDITSPVSGVEVGEGSVFPAERCGDLGCLGRMGASAGGDKTEKRWQGRAEGNDDGRTHLSRCPTVFVSRFLAPDLNPWPALPF